MRRRTQPKILCIALRMAIKWEESLLDAMFGCKSPSDLEFIEYTRQNIEDFKRLLEKIGE